MLSAETLKKLEERQVQLAELFIKETDIAAWPPNNETVARRADAYWYKRNAGATATLIVKIQTMLDVALKKPPITNPEDPVPGDPPEEEPANAEALAASAIDEAQKIIDKARDGRFGKGRK